MVNKNDFNPQCITFSQMNLIFNARIYYRRLTTLTNSYIFSRFYGIGTAEDLFERLYLESIDIGNMLHIIFGRVYSEEYGRLLSQFPIIFRDLLTAMLEGNTEAVNQNVERLYSNVNERAAFLAELNPYWNEEDYKELFGTYIQYVIETANAYITGNYNEDLEILNRFIAHTNRMGDTFAEGLYNYITSGAETQDNSEVQCVTYEEMNEIFLIRMFWYELVSWIRRYMMSRFMSIGDENKVYERLRQVPADYVNRLKPFFPNLDTEAYMQLFDNYIDLIDAFITAQMEGNVDELNQITRSLYQNAEERARFVSEINPFWDYNEARDLLYTNLRSTIEESTTFLTGDYARNIDIFSRLLDESENTSTFLAQGLFNYIISNQQNPA